MKYDAFISYRHAELDQFVAENLHKKLESFRLPKAIVKQRGADCKKKIERVFRDRDELPLATNLADPITDALENSEFLIVICSPRLPQSLWCKKEIETFISMHGRERVLAVLIEGEPEDSFPEELLYRTREITHEDGTVEVIKEPVEPLAADVRGTTKKEVLKKMDEELLRLTAAMFQCGYDDLKQRHKEQKMKKMLTASLAASAFFLVFGAVSTTMAIRIQSQKEQIQAQSEEITAQKERIEEQYQEALYNQSLTMAEKSLDLLEEGDRLEAMRVACEALGETEDGTAMPITAEAQYALAESSYLYQNGEAWLPMYMLKHDANLSMMQVSPDREHLLTADEHGTIYVWKVLENRIIAQIRGNYMADPSEETCFFINATQILYKGENSFEIYDIEKQEVVFNGEENFYHGKAGDNHKWFAVVVNDLYEEQLLIYNTTDFTLQHSYILPEGKEADYAMAFDEEKGILAFIMKPLFEDEEPGAVVVTMDLNTGELTGEIPLEYSSVAKLQIEEGVLYAGVSQTIDEASPDGKIDVSIAYKSILYAINMEDMSVKWEYHHDEGSIRDFKINAADFSRHIMVSYYLESQMLDMDTGVEEYQYIYGDDIVSMLYYTTSDLFILITEAGEYHIISGEDGTDIVLEKYFQTNSDDLEQVLPIANGFASLPDMDCNITYYEMAVGPELEVLSEQSNDIINVYVNKAETRAVVECGYNYDEEKKVILMDLDNNIILNEISIDDDLKVITEIVLDGQEYFSIFMDEKVAFYNISDGTFYKEYALEEIYSPDEISISTDGAALIFKNLNLFGKLSLADGSVETLQVEGDDYSVVTNINHDFSAYAVADKSANKILLYQIGTEEAYAQIDVTASLVSDVMFTQDNRYLFVSYVNQTAAVYDVESGVCIQEYDELGYGPYSVATLGEEEGYLMKVFGDAYLLDNDFRMTTFLPGGAAVMPNTHKYLSVDKGVLYVRPIYTIEQMKEMAEQTFMSLNVKK